MWLFNAQLGVHAPSAGAACLRHSFATGKQSLLIEYKAFFHKPVAFFSAPVRLANTCFRSWQLVRTWLNLPASHSLRLVIASRWHHPVPVAGVASGLCNCRRCQLETACGNRFAGGSVHHVRFITLLAFHEFTNINAAKSPSSFHPAWLAYLDPLAEADVEHEAVKASRNRKAFR